jgi:hypothetical protein
VYLYSPLMALAHVPASVIFSAGIFASMGLVVYAVVEGVYIYIDWLDSICSLGSSRWSLCTALRAGLSNNTRAWKRRRTASRCGLS